MKTLLLYVPVVHKGVLDFLEPHLDARYVYIWGQSLIDTEQSLKKDIRALSPVLTGRSLVHLCERSIRVAEVGTLAEIARSAFPLILPDDDISHRLVDNVLLSHGLREFHFEPVFLRWNSVNASVGQSVLPDETKPITEFQFHVDSAQKESQRSSDWWRQVGAVLFDPKGSLVISAHNRHLPTDYTPYIDGDARGSFKKSVNIGLGSAIHAESAVIAEAAKIGVRTAGLSILTTTFPCPVCARLIAQSGISQVLYLSGYSMLDGFEVLEHAGVKIVHLV